MIEREITKLTNKIVSHSQWVQNADLTFDEIFLSLNLLKHRYVCSSLKVEAWQEGPPYLAMDRKMTILKNEHGSYSSRLN